MRILMTITIFAVVAGCQTVRNGYYADVKMSNGALFSGNVRNDIFHGQGTITYNAPHKEAGYKFVGEFKDGTPYGIITETYSSPHEKAGLKYVGEIKNNLRDGQGTITSSLPHEDAGYKYVGEVGGGKIQGIGTETYSLPHEQAGEKYVGKFKDNERDGHGTHSISLPHKMAGAKYVGEFSEGKYHGQGTLTFSLPHEAVGYKFVGEFKDGLLGRQGTIVISSGEEAGKKYVGEFRDGLHHGHGVLSFSSPNKRAGEKYIGEFKHNKFHGEGRYTYADGRVQEGIWKNHILKQAKKISSEFVSNNEHGSSSPKVTRKKGQSEGGETIGSGFFISKLGHVVTNQHVVEKCRNITVGDSAKRQVAAEIVETDKRNDLALLKISSTKMASADTKSLIRKLGIKVASRKVPLSSSGLLRSEDVELGEQVMVSGFPYGEIFSDTIKVTGGMVSATRGMGDDSGQFQIDAAVQQGNSGGPIYDGNGNIVGVVVSQLNKLKVAKVIGSLPENVNFGIKASTVRQFLTSAGLPTKWSNQSERVSSKNLAKIAKNQTLMVVCNH
jgi:S1-C subfamily serine protease